MFRVELNHCNCHPETCCCNDWKVVDEQGNKQSTHFYKQDADRICAALNERIELEQRVKELEEQLNA